VRLVRFGARGAERPGVLDADGTLRDVSGAVRDYDPAFFRARDWQRRLPEAAAAAPAVDGPVRLGVPVAGTSKIVGLGMNFRAGLARLGLPVPEEPLLFIKAATSLAAAGDPILLPPDAAKLDWEVELAVVVGRELYRATVEDAEAAIAGYAVLNDLSERVWQNERGGEWCKGKSADGFAPLGPWLVTPDEVGDPAGLELRLLLNGAEVQRAPASDMVFGPREALAYASRFMRLLPCDVLALGTPPGTGQRLGPPRFLRAGDRLRLSITGLGEQVTEVVAERAMAR
jgi:2-keto-4-pentenoate hydratase/2-oxohepta-3-ene-1,7-dioic acid hydratase in catechol pathway